MLEIRTNVQNTVMSVSAADPHPISPGSAADLIGSRGNLGR
jgi:hypothetical protein